MGRACRVLTLAVLAGVVSGLGSPAAADTRLGKEDRRWLEKVGPLMTPEEMGIFLELDASDRGRFREIFWARRDPDPRTPGSELEAEFEARYAVADRHFRQAGLTGSATDMGKVFLLLGPAVQVVEGRVDSGESPLGEVECETCEMEQEATSVTEVGPTAGLDETRYLTWRYGPDPLVGIPRGLDVEFRSQSTLGYRLVEDSEVKRALERARRLYVSNPALGYELDEAGRLAPPPALPRAGEAPDPALASDPNAAASTSGVAFRALPSYFASEGEGCYAPLLLRIEPDSLTWEHGVTEVSVSGCVETVGVEGAEPFRLRVALAQDADGGVRLELPFTLTPGRHKLRLAVQDDASGRTGVRVLDLVAPDFGSGALTMSSVVGYSESWEAEPSPAVPGRAFRFGRLRVVPRVAFKRDQTIGLLYFVYGLAEAAADPPVVQYAFFRDGTLCGQTRESPLPVAGFRALGNTEIPLESLAPGRYTLVVEVTDRTSGTTLSRTFDFELREASS